MESQPGDSASPFVTYSKKWADTLTNGHGAPRGFRGIMRHIPAEPRCKMCSSPFAGPGKAMRFLGFSPSRKNPNFCGRCIEAMPLGGAEIDIAVLFADLRGSTVLGESLGAQQFAALLHRFYHVATTVLLAHDAVIDKLIGDEVMALFIPGFAGPRYRARAVEAGVSLLRALGAEDGKEPWIAVGIGVHAGTAFVGNVGGEVADFTALGDTVNTAARIQGVAKAGELAVSEELYVSSDLDLPSGQAVPVNLKGKAEPVNIRTIRL